VETTIGELAQRINTLTGNSTPIALAPARDWDRSGQRFGDPSKAAEKLGFKASVAHSDGLERTVAWTRENRTRILRCMMQHVRFVPQVRSYA
jgi:UDP-glucose 4-epimerase